MSNDRGRLQMRETWVIVVGLLENAIPLLYFLLQAAGVDVNIDLEAMVALLAAGTVTTGVGTYGQVRRAQQRIDEADHAKPEPKFGFDTDAVSTTEVPEDE